MAACIPRNRISHEYLKSVLFYNKDTGEFIWKERISIRITVNRRAGYLKQTEWGDYWMIGINGEEIRAANLAWFYVTGDWPTEEIDHKNRVSYDDRWNNLRLATSSQQKANRSIQRNNTSGYRGVSYHRATGKYRACSKENGRQISLGLFKTAQEASVAHEKYMKDKFGEFGDASN